MALSEIDYGGAGENLESALEETQTIWASRDAYLWIWILLVYLVMCYNNMLNQQISTIFIPRHGRRMHTKMIQNYNIFKRVMINHEKYNQTNISNNGIYTEQNIQTEWVSKDESIVALLLNLHADFFLTQVSE